MVAYSGFMRKSPSERLRAFFSHRGIHAEEGFDWKSEGRGTVLVAAINDLIKTLPPLDQDAVKAELDLLATLSSETGIVAAQQICAAAGIELEPNEGTQDILLRLAIEYPTIIDRVAAQASLMKRTGGKSWSAFQIDGNGADWDFASPELRNAFLKDSVSILNVPEHRKREADWYRSIRTHPVTGEETEIIHATIYVEDNAECELGFSTNETLERQVVQRVLEVGVAFDPRQRILEVCAKGGKGARDKYAAAFAKQFLPGSDQPVEAPRREVCLDSLYEKPRFRTEPSDGIESVRVVGCDFFAHGGGFMKFEKFGPDQDIYEFLRKRFAERSPLVAPGWTMVSATIRIGLVGRQGRRPKSLIVTVRTPNTTTLPNKTEEDRQFVFRLLERWGIILPLESTSGCEGD